MSAAIPTNASAGEYKQVALTDLDTRYSALRLADPKAMAALSGSLGRHGVLQPLTVNSEGEALVVLDGFKRLRILGQTLEATIPVRIVKLTAPQAKVALVTFNRPHRGVSELEEAWIVQALVTEHGMLQKDIAKLIGRHKSWICRRLQLAQRLDASVVEDMRLGLVSATVARELVRLPRGNQIHAANAISQHALSSRQASQLIDRVQQAPNQAGVDELLCDPMRFLDATTNYNNKKARHPRDARLSAEGGKLCASVDALTQQAGIINVMVNSSASRLIGASDREVLRSHVDEATQTLNIVMASLSHFVCADA